MDSIGVIITAVVITVCADSTESLKTEFVQMGFTVQATDKTTLLVTGSSTLFEEKFDIEVSVIDSDNTRAGVFVKATDSHTDEVTMQQEWSSRLPLKYKSLIKQVEFEQPISFGPTDY